MELTKIMKKMLLAAIASAALVGCTSVESATVSSSEIVASGGESVAVIQASAIGISAIFYLVDIVTADLDVAVNKLLVAEAKAMGATKVDLKGASTNPRHGIFALFGNILSFPTATAMGIAVK
jgi:Zn-dependent alcohol dehydrogenase